MPWTWRGVRRPDDHPYEGWSPVRKRRARRTHRAAPRAFVRHESPPPQVQTLLLPDARTFFYVLPPDGLRMEDIPRILLVLLLEMPDEFDPDLAIEILKMLPRRH